MKQNYKLLRSDPNLSIKTSQFLQTADNAFLNYIYEYNFRFSIYYIF